jgi:hypothetical protein
MVARRRAAGFVSLASTALLLQECAFVSPSARSQRSAPRVALLADSRNDAGAEDGERPVALQVPQVNYFASIEIMDCLTEGCTTERLYELEEKMHTDELAIAEHVEELRAAQEGVHSPDVAEALAWFRTVAENSKQLRPQLEMSKDAHAERVKAIKNSEFAQEFAASLVVGSGSSDEDYLNEGAISIWRMLSRSRQSRSVPA